MSLPYVTIDYLGILIAVVVSFLFGWFWYSPIGFGKKWIKLNGFSKAEIKKKHSEGMGMKMLLNIIGTVITVSVVAYLVNILTISDFWEGAKFGVLVWLGFFAGGTLLGSVLWEGKPWGLYVLNGAYWIINLVLISGIVAVWA